MYLQCKRFSNESNGRTSDCDDTNILAESLAMAVYVDDMYKSPIGQFRGMKMSHMIADTSKELRAMAKKIGVKQKWIQDEGTYSEHFDISLSKRKIAIEKGAKPISFMDFGRMLNDRMPLPSGIYKIENVQTGEVYI